MNIYYWLSWIQSALILFLIIVFIKMLENPARLLIMGKKAQGTMARMDKKDSLLAPVVQFVTYSGQQVEVTGKNYSESTSGKVGSRVRVLYDPAAPLDAQLLMWSEFYGILAIMGFIVFILAIWISGVLIEPESGLDDPLHIISSIIYQLKLSPTRFPFFFLVPVAIFVCGMGTYVTGKTIFDLKINGIKVTGHVILPANKNFPDNSSKNDDAAVITYADLSGKEYTTLRYLAQFFTSLKDGDKVEMIYSPDHPDRAYENDWNGLYITCLFFALMFHAFLFLFGMVLYGKIRL